MRSPVSAGYIRPRAGVIRAASWLLVDSRGDTDELPDALADWDYHQSIHVTTNLEVVGDLRAETDLPSTASIRAHLQWHSTGTGLRGSGPVVELEDGSTRVNLHLAGDQLGGTLNLEVRVILGGLNGPTISPYAASRPGAILWSEGRKTHLEGAGTRFPVTQLSFANTGIAGGLGAAWCLQLDSSDLADSAAGSLRLFLNTDQEHVREYLQRPELPTAEQFTRNVRFAIQRQLVAIACEHEELDTDTDYESGSLGELLATLVRQVFPNRDLRSLQGDLRRNPGEFEAELQARAGYLP